MASQIEGHGRLKCVNNVDYNGDWRHSQVRVVTFRGYIREHNYDIRDWESDVYSVHSNTAGCIIGFVRIILARRGLWWRLVAHSVLSTLVSSGWLGPPLLSFSEHLSDMYFYYHFYYQHRKF